MLALAAMTGAGLCEPAAPSSVYVVRYDAWSEEDERAYREFIQAIGESDCGTVDACLHSAANPVRAPTTS